MTEALEAALSADTAPADAIGDEPVWWPTTALQRGLVAHAAVCAEAGTADPYVGQTRIRIDGGLDPAHAGQATAALLAGLPNLRAGFLIDDAGDPLAFVEPLAEPALAEAFRLAPAGSSAAEVARAEREAGFDLELPPLVRLVLVPAGPRRHELVVTAHHCVLDGWSMPLLLGQWLRHLAAARGESAPESLPRAGAGYERHLAWLAGRDRGAAAAHFADELAGAGEEDLPHWLAGPDAAGTERRVRTAVLDAATARSLERTCRRLGLTPAGAVRAAWGLAADFAGGTRGAVFAVPVALRNPDECDPDPEEGGQICGMLTESVLARLDYAPGDTLGQVALRHQDAWAASLPHQHLGVRGIEAAVASPREAAWSLVGFDAAAPATAFTLDSGLQARLSATADGSHYPVAAHATAGQEWTLQVETDPHRVPAASAEALMDAFTQALRALAGTPETPVAGTVLLGDRSVRGFEVSRFEVSRLEAGRSAPSPVPAGTPALLPELFRARVAATPGRTALVAAGVRHSFADLSSAAADVAGRLRALLADPGTTGAPVLALRLPRTAEQVAAILGALEAGLAVMPLDPAWPQARRDRALALSRAALVWDAEGLRPTGAPGTAAAAQAPTAASTASVIFTSGSTGEPKGVAVSHGALAHLFERHRTELYPQGRVLRVAHSAAFHFDAHWDAFMSLFAGHEMHLLTEEQYLDAHALATYVRREGIGYLDFTPTLWNALLVQGGLDRLPELCVVGGEAFPAPLWERMRAMAASSGSRVFNLYGPTEATVDALAAEVSETENPTVGRPVGATRALVLDTLLRRVPAGTVGELYLAGPQLADGYLSRPALTAQRFVADPDHPGERLYRTGDAASWGTDGRLVLLGRTDAQISLHGVRIEPGEIEAFLLSRPGVQRAAVVKVTDPRLGERLAAYVVPEAGRAPAGDERRAERWGEELRADCAAGLPRAMVPAAVVVLDTLPVTGSGKLDTRALPAPVFGGRAADGAAAGGRNAEAPAAGAAELKAVTTALTAVLGLDTAPEPDADFMALGGDSISAIQAVAALRRAGHRLTVAALLAARTPAAMARALQPATDPTANTAGPAAGTAEARTAALGPARLAALREHVERHADSPLTDVWPLTPTQLGMVLHHERDGGSTYLTCTRWRIAADAATSLPTATAVRGALAALAGRHPQLRALIWQHDLPAPVLAIAARADLPWVEDDLRGAADPGTAAMEAAVADAEARLLARPMPLDQAPLGAAALLRTGDAEWTLLLCLHHLLADGWSTPLLTADLRTALAGHDLAAGPDMTGYLDWLAGLDAERPALEAAWRAGFAGFAGPTLLAPLAAGADAATAPTSDPVAGPARGTAVLDPAATRDLSAALRAGGHTLADAAQAAWACVLGAVTGRTDVALGATRSGRDADVEGIADTVGMFITTAPVRLRPVPGAASADLLGQARRQGTGLARAAHLGMGRIKALLGAEPFDTLLVVENYPADEPGSGPLRVQALGGSDGTNYPVCVTLQPGTALGLEVELQDGQGRHGPAAAATAQALAEATVAALAALASGTQPEPDALGLDDVAAQYARTAQHAGTGLPDSAAAGDTAAEPAVAGADSGAVPLAAAAIAAVLGLETVGPDDDLFALGGDSMSAIALVGALRARGLAVAVGDIYRAPTATALAALATPAVPTGATPGAETLGSETPGASARGAAEPVDGSLPATPALSWYAELLATGASGSGFQQLRLVATPAGLDAGMLAAALDALAAAHPALRLRVSAGFAEILPAESFRAAGGVPLTVLDAHADDAATTAALAAACARLDEGAGAVFTAVYRPGGDAGGRGLLALAAHHTAVDIYSWRVLVDDLRRFVADLPPVADPESGALNFGAQNPSAMNLAAWARAQHAAARTLEADAGLVARWERTLAPGLALSEAAARAAVDLGPVDLGTVGEAVEEVATLDAGTTAALLEAAAEHGMDNLLHAALAGALSGLSTLPGLPGGGPAPALVLEAEGHGRPLGTPLGDGRDGVDVSGTVGWFTATWPLRLDIPRAELLGAHVPGPGEWLAAALAARSAVPADGTSYGLLRHLAPTASGRLRAAEAAGGPQLLVNYLGRDTVEAGDWRPAADAAALESALGLHAGLPATHPVELNAYVADTADGPVLTLRWQFAAANATARALPARTADALAALAASDPRELAAAARPAAVHDAAGIGPAEAAAIVAAHPDADAVWPLTGVQRAMAVHARTADRDVYRSLAGLDLHGDLDHAALERAAADLFARHPQLRTVLHWPAAGDPVLVGRAGLVPGFEARTLHGLDDAGRAAASAAARAEQMDTGFDLGRGPLLRLLLLDFGAHPATGEAHHHLVLANHHLLLDGWSIPPLVDELLAGIADAAGDRPAPVGPAGSGYDAYVRTFAGRDDAAAASAWARRLRDAGAGHVLPTGHLENGDPEKGAAVDGGRPGMATATVDPAVHDRLRTACRAAGATVAEAVHAAWALVLGALLDTDRPVFGTVSSGRPAGLPGADRMPGMFINTLPVTLELAPELARGATGGGTAPGSSALLRAAHAAQASLMADGSVPLAEITRALGVGTLFDTLVVVENYPAPDADTSAGGLRLGEIVSDDATDYPLCLSVDTGNGHAGLGLELEHDARIRPGTAEALLGAVAEALEALAAGTDLPALRRDLASRLGEARGTLAALRSQRPAAAPGGGAPAATVAAAYASALGLNAVGLDAVETDADFFRLGGDSIRAMAVVAALRERGFAATVAQVFGTPVAADLAAVVRPITADASPTDKPPTATQPTDAPPAGPPKPMISLGGAALASLNDLLRGTP
ncbi:hypothetical protein GCM10023081_27580 [Arthrobacter ginkgonis]|uniref:Carrier domain-containing protein n=1 Tax=Arthrobacter ginkgonis TaxID=1630594 RepID=A0ABP7CE71_9MICC